MGEQIDIAVDLGVVAEPLPDILSLRQLVETASAPPPELIEGVLHQGCTSSRPYRHSRARPTLNS